MLIKVKDGTYNKTDSRNKMHKSRRKILDVMNGDYRKDTFGWTESQDDRQERLSREEENRRAKSEIFKEFRVPSFCPKCNQHMKNKFDTKFYYRTGHCFTCQQDFEHKLRVTGLYPLWERIKVFENEISILTELKVQFTEALSEDSDSKSELVSANGIITGFEFAGNWEAIRDGIQTELDDIVYILPEANKELNRMRQELVIKDDEKIVEQYSTNR